MGRNTNSGGGGLLLLGAVAVAIVAAGNTTDTGAGPSDSTSASAVSGEYAVPADGPVTSGFGARWGTTHYGLDIGAPMGSPIRAVAAGTVIKAGPASGFGLWMQVRHHDGTVTVYGHMNTIDREQGAEVAAGEQIATVGDRGQSTAPHLHIEVWPHGQRAQRVDPRPWLAERGIAL